MKHYLLTILFLVISFNLSAQVIEKSYLQTDRTLYATQDTVYFKGYVFDQQNKLSDQSIALHVLLSDEEGNKIRDKKWPIFDGLVEGSFLTPSREGKYYLSAFSGQMAGTNLIFQKEIYVRSEIADEVALDIERLTPSNDGQSLEIDLNVNLSSREVAKGTQLNYSIWSDTSLVSEASIKTTSEGKAKISFTGLDQANQNYEVLVDVADGELQKPVRLAIPLNAYQKKVDLQFLPEGGNIVANLKNKIAFKAIDNNGRPFDFEGELLDEQGKVITKVKSFYEGMGHFDLTPESDKPYSFRITKPIIADTSYQLPASIDNGITLTTRNSGSDQQVFLELKASKAIIGQVLKVSVQQQGGTVFERELIAKSREFINLPLQGANPGIGKATIYDQLGNILSERLLFLKAKQRLLVKLETSKNQYDPREKVVLKLKATDLEGNPVSGAFNIAVIDKTRAGNIGDNNPNMLAQILLNSELKGDIPTPNFYFSDDSRAVQALDYVMLTNGWRKYSTSPFLNPEGLNGSLIQRNRKKKVVSNTTLKLYSIDGLVENIIPVDNNGKFSIPSSYLKAKGDSFLLATSTKDKVFSPNIKLVDTTKLLSNAYKNQLIHGLASSFERPDFKVYQRINKVDPDRFQDVTILNSFTITDRNFFGNACDALALDTEGNWVTKTAEQLDLSNLDFMTLIKQVSDKVLGYGPLSTRRVSYDMSIPALRSTRPGNSGINGFFNDALATGAILSPYTDRASFSFRLRSGGRVSRSIILEWPVPFDVYINCEFIEPHDNRERRYPYEYYKNYNFENIDLRNLESISVNAPATAGRTSRLFPNYDLMTIVPRPIIVIKTRGGEIIHKPRLNTYYFYTTYQKQESSFYKPQYETEEQINSPIYDLRNTIHWETDIITDQNGEASVTFYNADRPNTIGITVEGIDAYSRMGYGTTQYQVNSPDEDKE